METIADLTRGPGRTSPAHPAIICEGETLSYGELDARASRVANGLQAMGSGPGARVCFLARNSAAFAEVMQGAAKARCILVPLNWRLAGPEIEFITSDCSPVLIVVEPEFEEIARALSCAAKILVIGAGNEGDFAAWRDAQAGTDPMLAGGRDDVALIMYTSGTTGLPKGVQLMHRNLLAHLAFIDAGAFGHWVPDDLQLICLPLFHVGGTDSLLWSFYTGSQVLLLRDAAAQTIVDAFRAHRVTIAGFVPTIMAMVLDHPDTAGLDFSALRLVSYGGSPISPELLQQAYATFGCRFQQLFGMTEATGGVVMLADEDHRGDPALLKACGRPLPTTQLKVVDSDGHALQAGEVGEIAVRSPTMMKGYWQRPEETAKAFRDGWYLTGDAGNFDAQGYLYIRDRIKDMVVSGGENIYPTEVEIALRRHPDVAEVAVIGVPDPKWGEAVKAVVVRQPGSALDDVGLIAFARTYLAGFKCPKSVDFVAELPKNAAGKVLRRELRKQYWSGNERQVG